MGYPGIFTDKIMDLVKELRSRAVQRANLKSIAARAHLDEALDVLEREIHSQVSMMDRTEEEYAESMSGC